jgi:hypothetical protein
MKESYGFKEGVVDFIVGFTEGGAETALPMLGAICTLKHCLKGNKVYAAISAVYTVLGTARVIVHHANGSVYEKMEHDAASLKEWLGIKQTE